VLEGKSREKGPGCPVCEGGRVGSKKGKGKVSRAHRNRDEQKKGLWGKNKCIDVRGGKERKKKRGAWCREKRARRERGGQKKQCQ